MPSTAIAAVGGIILDIKCAEQRLVFLFDDKWLFALLNNSVHEVFDSTIVSFVEDQTVN